MLKLTERSVLSKTKASELKNVKRLNFWANELTDISVVRKMPNISIVCLSVNNIIGLADFSNCINLEELYVRKNNISNISELYYLECLPKLRVLWLDGSPCTSETNYRLRVIRILPRLHKLDNIAVDEDEVSQAMELSPDPKPTHFLSDHTTLRPSGEKQCLCSDIGTVLEGNKPSQSPVTVFPKPTPSRGDLELYSVGQPMPSNNGCSMNQETYEGASTDAKVQVEIPIPTKLELDAAKVMQEPEYFGLPWNSTCDIADQLAIEQVMEESSTTSQANETTDSIRVANILQAALCLISELECDGLEIVADAVRKRLHTKH